VPRTRSHLVLVNSVRASQFRMLVVFVVVIAGFRHSFAQEYPQWEAFTGFSYARVNLGGQSAAFQPTGKNYYGLHINGSFSPRRYLRIILCDFAAQVGRTTINVAPEHADVRTSQVLFGSEFVRRTAKSSLFAHTLIGVTNTRLVSTIGGHDIVPDLAGRTNLAFGLGGGIDLHLTHMLSVRAVQADYIPTRMAGTWENEIRLSSGVVWTFDYRHSR